MKGQCKHLFQVDWQYKNLTIGHSVMARHSKHALNKSKKQVARQLNDKDTELILTFEDAQRICDCKID